MGFVYEEKQMIKECFSLYDYDNNGKIEIDDLETVLRAMGGAPTEREMRDIQEEADPDGSGNVEFEKFLKVLENHKVDVDDLEMQMKDAFRVFDKDQTGYISAAELRHVMSTLGEPLDEDDVDDIILDANVEEGMINYSQLVHLLTSKYQPKPVE